MNRRSFFRSLAATALVAVASQTRLARASLELVDDPISAGQRYSEYLARSMCETKETMAANLLRMEL